MRLLLKVSLLLAALFSLAAAAKVTTGDEHYKEFRAVGEKLKCQCSCAYTIASCNMLNCHYREQVKPEIMAQIEAGIPADQIIRSIIEKYGTELMTAPRTRGFGLFGWAMPFVALLLGLIIAPFFVRKWRAQHAAAAAEAKVDDAALAKFRSQIEKDLEALD